jgi:hypothetical protein
LVGWWEGDGEKSECGSGKVRRWEDGRPGGWEAVRRGR